jgi:hypothetical protein
MVLPDNWSIELEQDQAVATTTHEVIRPDALMTFHAPDGNDAIMVIEAKTRLSPRDVPAVTNQIRRYQDILEGASGLVLASFLSPRTRELLVAAGLSYADATGNVRLVLDRPALFISSDGESSDPWSRGEVRSLRSLKGPTASRVIRALCDFRPPFGVQQLAERSVTSLGSVSRVFSFLESEALIVREPYGPVTDVDWVDLIRRWTADYTFPKSNQTRTFLEPRALPALLDKLRVASWRYAITGSLAASVIAPIAPPRLATIYVDDAVEAAQRLRLRPADSGVNVILAEPFDPVVYDRAGEHDGVRYVAPSQAAADLLTGPGRSPAEGEELIRWMKEHEDAWRA